ncbi:neuronal acetylcholine receptor subunit alpha-7-like [Gigantopelta aegis]|uniref:neuronal acetylcholine receptor subunit alpha-7-like n=1 Tax=Gigantopelta aegis TaxID=1735272 RepID=UPI001B88CD4C|nr:neuronal acetylcholine receptor subunit alpha-7-like [Gigantopelta aegis]
MVMTANVNDVARLHTHLFSNYNKVIPPVYNQSHPVAVKLSLFLLMIMDLQWNDEFLRWNVSEFGGVEDIVVAQGMVWLPDILVENTAQNFAEQGNAATLISIEHTGRLHWEPGILTRTICEVNIGKYPFDYQMCEIKFLTWMHTNKTLEVMPGSKNVSLEACIQNGEWDIISAESESYFYPSTYRPGTKHTGVTFKIHLLRKRTFYVLNTIVPVVMLSMLNVLVFLLPASSGEKMALAVTVLLSFTVYLSIISEVMPKTSESISILAVYLTVLLTLSTMSVLSSGIVMNLIHKDPDKPIPRWLTCVLFCRLRKLKKRRTLELQRMKEQYFQLSVRRYENGDAMRRFSDESRTHTETRSLVESKVDKDTGGIQDFSNLFDDNEAEVTLEDISWNEVGAAIDNVLFWIFLLLTLTSTATVFTMFSF